MVTSVAGKTATTNTVQRHSLWGRAITHARQFVCGLHGHDALLHFEQNRLSLQCTSCGYETPGWDLKTARTAAPAAAKARVLRLPLIQERRVA
jgi:hypothetical protein